MVVELIDLACLRLCWKRRAVLLLEHTFDVEEVASAYEVIGMPEVNLQRP